jgi:hypothetical protein
VIAVQAVTVVEYVLVDDIADCSTGNATYAAAHEAGEDQTDDATDCGTGRTSSHTDCHTGTGTGNSRGDTTGCAGECANRAADATGAVEDFNVMGIALGAGENYLLLGGWSGGFEHIGS